jgi:hypothetical protein
MAETPVFEIDDATRDDRKGGRKGSALLFGRRRACVDFTPYINSCLISTHFK